MPELLAKDFDAGNYPQVGWETATSSTTPDRSLDSRAIFSEGAPTGEYEDNTVTVEFDYEHYVQGMHIQSSGGSSYFANLRKPGDAYLRYDGNEVGDRYPLSVDDIPYFSATADDEEDFAQQLALALFDDGFAGGSSGAGTTSSVEKELNGACTAVIGGGFDPTLLELVIESNAIDADAETVVVCTFEYGDPYVDDPPIQAVPRPGVKGASLYGMKACVLKGPPPLPRSIMHDTFEPGPREISVQTKPLLWGQGVVNLQRYDNLYQWDEDFFDAPLLGMEFRDRAQQEEAGDFETIARFYAFIDVAVTRSYIFFLMEDGSVWRAPSPPDTYLDSGFRTAVERVTHIPRCTRLKMSDNNVLMFFGAGGELCYFKDTVMDHPATIVTGGSPIVDAVIFDGAAPLYEEPRVIALYVLSDGAIRSTDSETSIPGDSWFEEPPVDGIAAGWDTDSPVVQLEANTVSMGDGGFVTGARHADGSLELKGDYFHGLNGEAPSTFLRIGNGRGGYDFRVKDFAINRWGFSYTTEAGNAATYGHKDDFLQMQLTPVDPLEPYPDGEEELFGMFGGGVFLASQNNVDRFIEVAANGMYSEGARFNLLSAEVVLSTEEVQHAGYYGIPGGGPEESGPLNPEDTDAVYRFTGIKVLSSSGNPNISGRNGPTPNDTPTPDDFEITGKYYSVLHDYGEYGNSPYHTAIRLDESVPITFVDTRPDGNGSGGPYVRFGIEATVYEVSTSHLYGDPNMPLGVRYLGFPVFQGNSSYPQMYAVLQPNNEGGMYTYFPNDAVYSDSQVAASLAEVGFTNSGGVYEGKFFVYASVPDLIAAKGGVVSVRHYPSLGDGPVSRDLFSLASYSVNPYVQEVYRYGVSLD